LCLAVQSGLSKLRILTKITCATLTFQIAEKS
jgi:hypothetical protein